MRTTAATLALIGAIATTPLAAQQRGGRHSAQGIPPGHLPPSGECRVWYDGRPPGHQPPPTSCREAERVAARDPRARVIYGGGKGVRRNDGREREGDWRDPDRTVPRRHPSEYPYPDRYPDPENRYPYPDRYPTERGRGYGYNSVPFDNGYKDGYDKGREDARDNDSYDPLRHSRYRSADRGYNGSYGSKDQYRNIYREGFRAGYDDGFRDTAGYGSDRRSGGFRLPWPF